MEFIDCLACQIKKDSSLYENSKYHEMTPTQCADTWTFHNKATVPQINGPRLYAVTYNPNNKSRRKKIYTNITNIFPHL